MTIPVNEIAQNVADITGLSQIEQLVNASTPHERVLKNLIDRTGKDLVREVGSAREGWSILNKFHTFTTVEGQDSYVLPADFYRMIEETLWEDNEIYRAKGSMTLQDWQLLRSSNYYHTTLYPRFRIQRGVRSSQLILEPVPASEVTYTFWYVSRNWLTDSEGTQEREQIEADNDIPVFDGDLMELGLLWRYKKSQGLNFTIEHAEFEKAKMSIFGTDMPREPLPLVRSGFRDRWIHNIPETGYGRI